MQEEDPNFNPPALQSKKEVYPHLHFVWTAFSDLSTERSLGYGAVGPIPWSAARAYALEYGITGAGFERFWALVRAADTAYLDHAAKEVRRKDVATKAQRN